MAWTEVERKADKVERPMSITLSNPIENHLKLQPGQNFQADIFNPRPDQALAAAIMRGQVQKIQ